MINTHNKIHIIKIKLKKNWLVLRSRVVAKICLIMCSANFGTNLQENDVRVVG